MRVTGNGPASDAVVLLSWRAEVILARVNDDCHAVICGQKLQIESESSYFTKVQVFNQLGEVVATIAEKHLAPGSCEQNLTEALSAGVIFMRMQAGPYVQTLPLILTIKSDISFLND